MSYTKEYILSLSTSIAGSVAIIADPTTDGGSTGVKTPELLKEELSGQQITTRVLTYLGLDSESLELGGPSNSSMSESTTSLSLPFPLSFLPCTGVDWDSLHSPNIWRTWLEREST